MSRQPLTLMSNRMVTTTIAIQRVSVDKILDLRHRILRAGLPPESARFEGDEDDTTRHFAASAMGSEGRLVGCLSFMFNSFDHEPAWQLRGMAVDSSDQRRGVGQELIEHAEEALARDGKAGLLWCNARLPAVGFYQKLGWATVSAVFEIPTAGPHVKMTKRLKKSGFALETVENSHGNT
jgi:GNAT superfamily N-acetyltransferase